jgi:hypothetical protein
MQLLYELRIVVNIRITNEHMYSNLQRRKNVINVKKWHIISWNKNNLLSNKLKGNTTFLLRILTYFFQTL